MRKYSNEFKAGLFFIIAVLGFFYLMYSTGKLDVQQEGYTIQVIFEEVAGLEKKAPVMLNGLEVGKVDNVDVIYENNTTEIVLTLWLRHDAKIRENAAASIKTLGLMGEKYIQISSVKGDKFLEPGATINGKPYTDMDVLIDRANDISKDIQGLVGNVNTLTDEVKKLATTLNFTVENNQDRITHLITNLESTSKNMEEFSTDIKNHPWKLLFKTKEK